MRRFCLFLALAVASGSVGSGCRRGPPTGEVFTLEVDVEAALEEVPAGADGSVGAADQILDQTQSVLRNRLAALGYGNSTVQRAGARRLRVQVPEGAARARVENALTRRARLELLPVDTEASAFLQDLTLPADGSIVREVYRLERDADVYLAGKSDAEIRRLVGDRTPPGRRLLFGAVWDSAVSAHPRRTYVVQTQPRLTGDTIADASVGEDSYSPGEYYVSVELDARGAAIFADLTAEMVGELLAIVLDGEVLSAPRVMERITGGQARITLGRATNPSQARQEATDLALALAAGALPAPVSLTHP
jgi:preprotein translocase subunit SecD